MARTLPLILAAAALLALPARASSTYDPDDYSASHRAPACFPEVLKLREAKAFARAAELLEAEVARNPTDGQTWYELGREHLDAGAYAKAIAAFERSYAMGANFPCNTAYDLACAHARLGHGAETKLWLDRAMTGGFRDLDLLRKDPDLESVRGEAWFKDWAAAPDPSLGRDAAWRADLRLLAREIRRRHPDPYRGIPKADVDAFLAKLDRDVPTLSDAELRLAFIRLGAMIGDGHSGVWPRRGFYGRAGVSFFAFEEGIYITAADPRWGDLVGAQLLKVGGVPLDEALAKLRPYISRDNAMGVRNWEAILLAWPGLLHDLGLGKASDRAQYTVRDRGGRVREVEVAAITGKPGEGWTTLAAIAPGPVPLCLQHREEHLWFQPLPERHLMYVQYNEVQDGKEPLAAVAAQLAKALEDPAMDSLVVDLRWNGGGNSLLSGPLLRAIQQSRANRPGHLYAITGRQTFSAAMNFATDLDHDTFALFVGEPTGSSPQFIGETVPTTLPHSKLIATVSDLSWSRTWPWDKRCWIPPSIYAPPTFAAAKENRDPAMEAILARLAPQAK